MRILPLAFPLLAVAVCAGCAMDQSGTRSMGASGSASNEPMLYCKDGAHVSKSTGCGAGVEREITPASSATQ